MKFVTLGGVRLSLGGSFAVAFLCLLNFIMPSNAVQAAPAEAERIALLVEGAKKEGKVTYYHTSPADVGIKFLKKFQEKYPFLNFEAYRSGDESLMNKILAESQAKRYVFDVANTTGTTGEIIRRKGLFAKYLSPQRRFFPEACKDQEGYWTDTFLNLNTIVYNTKLVSPQEAPRSWNDLLDPRWKGKIGMDAKAYWWFANMLKVMGEKKGLDYMKRLGEQNIQFRNGRTLNVQLVAAGEVSIALPVYNYMVEELKSKGASVEWLAPDPVVPELHPLGISAHAPHPHAAKLLVDFLLSREGQELMASTSRIPSRTDVDALVPKLKKGLKILPFEHTIIDDYEKYVKLYREILMKR